MSKANSILRRIVTNSERSTSACDRKWSFRYQRRLSPLADSPAAFRQGSLVHRLLDNWYRRGMPDMNASCAFWQSVIEPWLEQRRHFATGDVDKAAAENAEIAKEAWGMFAHYVQHWHAHDAANWEVLAVSLTLARRVPYPGLTTTITDRVGHQAREWIMAGEVDLLVRDRRDGLHWIVEHKTTVSSNMSEFCNRLTLDPQVRAYAWLLRAPINVDACKVEGVIYNVLRKSVPYKPALLAVPKPTRLNPNPKSRGLSRKAIDTTAELYLATILEHGFNPDDYLDVLEDLKAKKFFHREYLPLDDEHLRDFEIDNGHWVLSRIDAERREYHSRQTSVCQGPGANTCQYAQLCDVENKHTLSLFRKRTVRHEELESAFADPEKTND